MMKIKNNCRTSSHKTLTPKINQIHMMRMNKERKERRKRKDRRK